MKAGDSFFLKSEAADKHRWVVISDPESHPDAVLFASMTSYDVTKEDVCLIVPGEHPFVKHQTCIDYSHARHATSDQLDTRVASQQILPSTPVSQDLLERIRRGASASEDLLQKYKRLLRSQGLIDGTTKSAPTEARDRDIATLRA